MNVRKKAQKSVPTAHRKAAEQKIRESNAFVVSAFSSLSELKPLVLKHDNAFGVFDAKGDALSSPGGTQGVYYCDTRHLSHFLIIVNDCRPMVLSSTLRDDNATLTCDLANPGLVDDGRVVVEHDLIHIRRTRFLWKASCFERLRVRNFDLQARNLRLGIEFAADFADLFEVRGMVRKKRGQVHEPEVRCERVTLSYIGLDDRRRSTTLRFDPAPEALTVNQAVFNLQLAPKETRSIFVEIDCCQGDSAVRPVRAYFTSLRDARRELLSKASRGVSIASSNDTFNESARRATADLYMLMTQLPEGLYPYAGIPWYSTVFGRDGLITAMMMLWVDPTVARGVLGHLAATQATEIDPAVDAEPGKILHEARHGEMADLREVPFRRYYGSVDSTPLFVMLAGEYLDRTDDVETCRRLWPNIEAALGWIEAYGDRDEDGLVEYGRRSAQGLANQGWKDSYDAIFHADGSLARGPIALAEVQAYVFAAWRSARRLPELICGFPRQRSRGPTFYPVACSPQAWAAATPLYLLQSCLGLSFESEANRIVFRRPVLPSFLDEIMLTGLSLPAGKVDVEVRRANRGFVVDVLDRSAAIEVLTIN